MSINNLLAEEEGRGDADGEKKRNLKETALFVLRETGILLRETFREWSRDNASQLGAALAYYTALSLAPLLILVVVIASTILKDNAIQSEIVAQTRNAMGEDAARVIQTILQNAHMSGSGILATVISIGMLMFGASGVFGQLKSALNTVWEIEPRPDRGVKGILKDRLISFAVVLEAGSLLILSLMLDTFLGVLSNQISVWFPALPGLVRMIVLLRTLQTVKIFVSFTVFTLLFAFIYKTLPDAEIAWKDVWIGGAATSLLFTLGNMLIGLYLGHSSIGSAYGAAGSLVALLVWVYYSAQVFFLGAEFTQVYANRYGSRIVPSDDAVQVVRQRRSRHEIFEMMRPSLIATGQTGPEEDEKPLPSAGETATGEESGRRRSLIRYGSIAAAALSLIAGVIVGVRRLREGRE
ncbi:MAG TPA: YihY/virulence factor BrkB family protein [Chloroflexi bacterium]|nr:YihY/virulence factor BrkB family protein [Chloroflexota bacterium]